MQSVSSSDIEPDQQLVSGLELDPYYPTHFLRGTRLVTQETSHNDRATKLVETLTAQDFLCMTEALKTQQNGSYLLAGLNIAKGVVLGMKFSTCHKHVDIDIALDNEEENNLNKSHDELEPMAIDPLMTSMQCSVEYPLFVTYSTNGKQGWSSYDPNKTLNLYGLEARQLQVGDKFIMLAGFDSQ